MHCSGGKVSICVPASYPDAIKTLLSGEHKSSKHILQHIRKYNRAFQMTSFGCNEDKIPGWQPTFRIKGQIQVGQRTIYLDNLDLKEYFFK